MLLSSQKCGVSGKVREWSPMQSQAQYVLRTVEERGIRFVQLWFTDVLGRHKAFHVTPAELEDALDQGMTFDGSSIDGFSRTQESDVLARPDLTTFQLLPWYEEGAGVARVFCDIVNIDGTPFDGCPPPATAPRPRRSARPGLHLLRRARDRVLLLRGTSTPTTAPGADRPGQLLRPPARRHGQSTATSNRPHARRDGDRRRARPARRRTRSTRDRPALHRRPDHGRHGHVGAPRREGVGASVRRVGELHAQAARQRPGLGHAHAPLAVARRPERLHRRRSLRSERRRHQVHRRTRATRARDHRGDQPVGQLLQAPRARQPRRRSRPSGPATTPPHWCASRRSSPDGSIRRASSTASPDPAANPYLAFAVILAAGLRGVRGDYELPTEGERTAPLPQSLAEALDLMECSALLHETLGEHQVEWFLRNKRAEWDAYRGQVTPFELERYLPLL